MEKINSYIISLPCELCKDNNSIEKCLNEKCGNIVRWAVIYCDNIECKVSVSCKVEA